MEAGPLAVSFLVFMFSKSATFNSSDKNTVAQLVGRAFVQGLKG